MRPASIERATHGERSLVEDVGVDHGRLDILMAQQFLYGANVVAGFEQVGSKGVAKGMRCDMLVDLSGVRGAAHGALQDRLIGMVAAHLFAARVDGESVGGEDILPEPLVGWVGLFAGQGEGQVDFSQPFGEVLLMQPADGAQVRLQRGDKALRQQSDPVLIAFGVSD
jgi:hypothetical protein